MWISGGVFLIAVAVLAISFSPVFPQAAPLMADDAPRSFHTLDEFQEWRDQYPARLDVNGDCDVLAEYLSRLAAGDGFLLGYTYVPYTGVIDGIRVMPLDDWQSHVANLIMTDTSLYYYDDLIKETIYIGER